MLDVIVPVHYKNAYRAATETLVSLANVSEVPLRFILSAQGGSHDDWNIVRAFLDELRDEQGLHYGLLRHETKVSSSWAAAAEAVEHIKHDYVLFLDPRIRIKDPGYFRKMTAPIRIAPAVGGVWITEQFMGSSTMHPNPEKDNSRMLDGLSFMTTRDVIEMCRPFVRSKTFFQSFQLDLIRHGAVRWQAPGVTFDVASLQDPWEAHPGR